MVWICNRKPGSGLRSSGQPHTVTRRSVGVGTTAGHHGRPARGTSETAGYIPLPVQSARTGSGGSTGVRLGGRSLAQPDVQGHSPARARRRVLRNRHRLLAGPDRLPTAVTHHRAVLHARDQARRSWSACGHARVVSALQSGHREQWFANFRNLLSTVAFGCALTGTPPARGAVARGPSRRPPHRRRTARTCPHGSQGRPADARRHRPGSLEGGR